MRCDKLKPLKITLIVLVIYLWVSYAFETLENLMETDK